MLVGKKSNLIAQFNDKQMTDTEKDAISFLFFWPCQKPEGRGGRNG